MSTVAMDVIDLLDLDRDSPVFLFKCSLLLAVFFPLQEAGNGSSYVKMGRELPKKEGSVQLRASSGP